MFVKFHPILYVFLITFHTVQCGKECSSFEYVERTLERMLKTENDMSTLKVQTAEIIKELQEQMTEERNELKLQMKNERKEMKNATDEALSNMQEQMTDERNELKQQMTADKTEMQDNLKAIQTEREEMANATDKALSNLETFTSDINATMYQVATYVTDLAAIEEINFQAHNPSTLSPTSSSVPFIFTTVDVNNGGGYSETTGIFTTPVSGLYAFSLQVCTNKKHIFPAIVKENVVLLPTRHYSSNTACTSSSVYTQLSAGDKVWVKCTACSSSSNYGMYEQSTYNWNAFSGTLVHK